MNKKNAIGHLLALTTITIWSSTFILSKVVLEQLSPLQVLGIRYALALVFLSLLHPRFGKPKRWSEELFFLLSGVGLAAYFVCENSALQRTYSSNVSLIVATIPLMTGILSMAVYKTPFLNRKSLAGFAAAYGGVFLVILNGRRFAGIEPMGDFLALLAALLFAVYTLTMQRIQEGHHLIALTRKVFAYGFFFLLGMMLCTGESLDDVRFSGQLVASLLFLGIVASSLAFLMWNRAIQCIGSVKVNQYIYLVPVVTTVFAALFLKERITLYTVAGAGLILSGLYISEKAQGELAGR
ncbi:DMT family transporter [Anaerotalea alkaliphila]|uniref:DMT family transporter n=1 Tax=Anaerotalea alkaliphila TaxID=2662126 RepID=A0A7X5HX80_9FIRM|nr:DMT family transporter [Anaerotalea alkaliphila]NDL68334.1 DMT family transporter [Anaerotalea alkaliphila]